jgi:sulfate permease, SulP family
MHFQVEDIVPFLGWLRSYRRGFFKPDLFAGLTVAVVTVPQSMAYALIAGLPVQYGLYASIVPTIAACLWGSSAHLVTGPAIPISLAVFGSLSQMAQPGSAEYLQLVLFLALLVGVIQFIMGLARLGTLLNFVSHAVLTGFISGAAVLIGIQQLPNLLGLSLPRSGMLYDHLYELAVNLQHTQWLSLGLGLLTIAVLLGIRKWRPTWPGTLIALVIAGGAVAVFKLEKTVAVVGAIPSSLPPPALPNMALFGRLDQLAPAALAIAILGLVEAVSIAKALAEQSRQRLNINQEFIGQAVSNIAAGLFSGFPGSGSFTRSAVNMRSGARTPMSGIISGTMVAATVVLAAPLAAKLPLAALAGVLCVIAVDLIRMDEIVRTVKATRSDATVLVITFLCTLLLSIQFAIYVGVLLSIGLHLAATSHPQVYSVIPDLETGKMVGSAYGETCCQMDIVCIEGSVFFGSAEYVMDDLQRRLRNHPNVANLLIRMHKVNTIDASGVHILEQILAELRHRGGDLFVSALNHRVFVVLKNSGFLREIGENNVRTATGSAIRQAMRETFWPDICAACPYLIFRECAELKKGNWEIFGKGVQPRSCPLPQEATEIRSDGSKKT